MVAPAEHSHAGPAVSRDPRRPSHLLSWPAGFDAEPAADDGSGPAESYQPDDGPFDLGAWCSSRRQGDQTVLAAVYPNHSSSVPTGLDVAALTQVAVDFDADDGSRRAFTGDTMPTSLRALRNWATDQLAGRNGPVDDVVLVLSELATNVERHAEGWVTVDLIDTQGVLLVAVTDPAVDRLPRPRDVGPEELTGRGLLVVASLSLAWGVVVRPSSKTVWAALPVAPLDRVPTRHPQH